MSSDKPLAIMYKTLDEKRQLLVETRKLMHDEPNYRNTHVHNEWSLVQDIEKLQRFITYIESKDRFDLITTVLNLAFIVQRIMPETNPLQSDLSSLISSIEEYQK